MSGPSINPSNISVANAAVPTPFADDPKRQTRRWSRVLRRFAAGIAAFAAALIGIYTYHWYRVEQGLQDAIAETDRLDPGWRLAELEAKRGVIPDAQILAPHVHKAGTGAIAELNKMTNRRDFVDSTEPLKTLSPQTRLTLDQTTALRAALASLALPLADGHKVAAYPKGRYAFDTSPPFNYSLPHVDNSGITAWLLAGDAMLQIQDRDFDRAWACCHAIQNIGRSFGDVPQEISQLVRARQCKEAIRLMERTLAQGHVRADELAESQKLLLEELRHPAMLISLRGDRAHLHHVLSQVETGQFRMSELKLQLAGNPNDPGIKDELRGFLSIHEVKPAHAWLLRFMTQAVEISKLPEQEAYPLLKKLESTLADAPELARLLAPKINRIAVNQERRALFACAYAGLAAERYRLKHDCWPSELADLVTERLLDEVPPDPYDGRPLRFRKTPDGVVVYSVGPSGNCKGDALDRNPPNVGEGRLEFRVWNGDRR